MALKRNVVQWDDALSRVDPRSFERLIAEYYLRRGFHVEHAGAEAREQQLDGNIDLRLHRGSEHIVVQCKHWRACQIMPSEVRELHQVMNDAGATAAIIITTGEFTDAALRVARLLQVQLIDGREIREMLDRVAVQQAERDPAPAPLPLRSPVPLRAARRPDGARPYLVPAMVLTGCLIATIGLSRSMALVRQGHDQPSAFAQEHVSGLVSPHGDAAAQRAVASIDGVVQTAWRGSSRMIVTVADGWRRSPATAAEACRALARADAASGIVVVVETTAHAGPSIEHACDPPMLRETVTMAGGGHTAH